MRKSATLVLALISAALLAMSSTAFAADGDGSDSDLSAAVGSDAGIFGVRYISASTPSVVLALNTGTNTMSGLVAVTVSEEARTGTNPWSVTSVLAADLEGTTLDTNTIARSNVSISPSSGTILQVLGGGTTSAGGGGTLDAARTVMSNSGQDDGTNYTGTYAIDSTVTLTVPNATPTDVYTGTITLTLVQ